MVNEVMDILTMMFDRLFYIWGMIFDKTGAWSMFISAFLAYTVYRFLLKPVIGGLTRAGASDVVKGVRGGADVTQKEVRSDE